MKAKKIKVNPIPFLTIFYTWKKNFLICWFAEIWRHFQEKDFKKTKKRIESKKYSVKYFFSKYFTSTVCLFKDGEINKGLSNKSTEFLQLWTYCIMIYSWYFIISNLRKNVIMTFLKKKNNESKTKKSYEIST